MLKHALPGSIVGFLVSFALCTAFGSQPEAAAVGSAIGSFGLLAFAALVDALS